MAWGPLTGFLTQAKAMGCRIMNSADKHLCLEEDFREKWSGPGRGEWWCRSDHLGYRENEHRGGTAWRQEAQLGLWPGMGRTRLR